MFLCMRPAPPLDALVEHLWANERPALMHARERSLPTGCADIVIPLLQTHLIRHDGDTDVNPQRLRGPVLQGACDRYLVRGGTAEPSSVVGVHFKPGGAARFAGVPMGELRNRTVTLDSLWGTAASELHEQLLALPDARARLARLERWLLARLARCGPAPDAAVLWAARQFDGGPAQARVDAIRAASGLGPARFIDRFRDTIGLTPKRYCRVRRLQAVLQRAAAPGPVDWAALSMDAGFADQAHLSHEFRRMTGSTPGSYRPVAPSQPNHVALPGPA